MWGRRGAAVLWFIFAVVTWLVVFDRAVAVSGAEVTRDAVERAGRGEAPRLLAEAYTPRVRQAALDATLWAGGVVLLGTFGFVAAAREASAADATTPATR